MEKSEQLFLSTVNFRNGMLSKFVIILVKTSKNHEIKILSKDDMRILSNYQFKEYFSENKQLKVIETEHLCSAYLSDSIIFKNIEELENLCKALWLADIALKPEPLYDYLNESGLSSIGFKRYKPNKFILKLGNLELCLNRINNSEEIIILDRGSIVNWTRTNFDFDSIDEYSKDYLEKIKITTFNKFSTVSYKVDTIEKIINFINKIQKIN